MGGLWKHILLCVRGYVNPMYANNVQNIPSGYIQVSTSKGAKIVPFRPSKKTDPSYRNSKGFLSNAIHNRNAFVQKRNLVLNMKERTITVSNNKVPLGTPIDNVDTSITDVYTTYVALQAKVEQAKNDFEAVKLSLGITKHNGSHKQLRNSQGSSISDEDGI